jgi:protein-tyrosine phosphatase
VGFVDIHAHLLPGIDDGPDDLGESVAMVGAAAAAGTSTLVATPHLRADFPAVDVFELAERCRALRAAAEDVAPTVNLLGGAETSLGWALAATDEELALASYAQRGTDLLIETPLSSMPAIEPILGELRSRGYRVVLAHPERSPDFQRDRERVRELVREGTLLQVNAGSLVSEAPRSRTRKLARWLCEQGLAHAIASDGHRASRWRPVGLLADGVAALGELVGDGRALWMAEAVPGAIVEGRELPPGPYVI